VELRVVDINRFVTSLTVVRSFKFIRTNTAVPTAINIRDDKDIEKVEKRLDKK
jgi:hypothetical protein